MAVTGIDGYPGGWISAQVSDASVTWVTRPVGAVADLLEQEGVVGIDMPIGLIERGWRSCDVLAKQALGSARSRVFMTPPRAVLELGLSTPNDTVQELSRALTGQGTSRQAMALAERILALDEAISQRPEATVVEVHPELSFSAMAGNALPSKKSAAGVGERLRALRPWLPTVDEALAAAPPDVPIDDALDALACAWSALRHQHGSGQRLPHDALTAPYIVF